MYGERSVTDATTIQAFKRYVLPPPDVIFRRWRRLERYFLKSGTRPRLLTAPVLFERRRNENRRRTFLGTRSKYLKYGRIHNTGGWGRVVAPDRVVCDSHRRYFLTKWRIAFLYRTFWSSLSVNVGCCCCCCCAVDIATCVPVMLFRNGGPETTVRD